MRAMRNGGLDGDRNLEPGRYVISQPSPVASNVQAVEILLDVVGSRRGTAHTPKPASLEHPNRSNVLRGDKRVERARRLVGQELHQRRGGDATSPVRSSDPVRDEPLAVLLPAGDVAHDLVADDDRLLA